MTTALKKEMADLTVEEQQNKSNVEPVGNYTAALCELVLGKQGSEITVEEGEALTNAFNDYSVSSDLHNRWAQYLLIAAFPWTSGATKIDNIRRIAGQAWSSAETWKQVERAATSLRCYYKSEVWRNPLPLSAMLKYYQAGFSHIYGAMFRHPTVAPVHAELFAYMTDPSSYCGGNVLLLPWMADAILDTAMAEAADDWQEGTDFLDSFSQIALAYFCQIVEIEEAENKAANAMEKQESLEEAITAFQSGKLSAFGFIMNHRELVEERKAMQEQLSNPLFQCYEHEPLTAGELDAVLDASLLDALETWQKGQRVTDSFSTFVCCKWQVIGYQRETGGKLKNTLANCMHRMGLPADTLEIFSKSSKKASAYYTLLAIDLLTALETADFMESLQDYSQYLPNRVGPAAWRAFRSYCKANALNVTHFPQV